MVAVSDRPVMDIFGTESDEDLIGTGRSELIFGLGGRDRIYGLGGNDMLYGGEGDDLLDGGTGRDEMYGGSGNDIYRVDDAGDVVSEESTPGSDDGGVEYVVSTIGYSLGNYIERLELRGTAAIDGAGNALDNTIKGNEAANILYGGDGSDILYGYGGDDVLIGGAGKDYLTGGGGADTFVLQPEAGAWDKIYDLTAEDRIGVYAGSFGLSEGAGLIDGVLDPAYFVAGSSATATGHGQFIFDASKKALLWDPDGAGGAGLVTLALLGGSATVTADQIVAYGTAAAGSVERMAAGAQAEDEGDAYFALRLSQALDRDVILTCSTIDGSAVAGEDFAALSFYDVFLKAGHTTAYVPVSLIDDAAAESPETFSLRLDGGRIAATGEAIDIGVSRAEMTIVDEGPRVVADHYTSALGMTDPSAIAFDPVSGTLFVADSEVEETPFSRPTNFFALGLDGSPKSQLALPFTTEPTGLAMDAANGRLFITDDDGYRVYAVDADDPGTVLWSFDTLPLGGTDPEDIAYDPETGHLFIVNGTVDCSIVEVDQRGTQVFDTLVLPPEISDAEALAFDPVEDAFYVGGGFSDHIWKLDRSGDILDVITVLEGASSEIDNHRVNVKDIELAEASDGSGETHLYVADYGWSHVDDGRIIEIDPGDGWIRDAWLVA